MKQSKIIFDSQSFSEQLLTKRVAKLRLNMREAADQIGISAPTLSRLENNSIPDVYTYYACCKWLGADMQQFFKET